jgi:hypothetical protein
MTFKQAAAIAAALVLCVLSLAAGLSGQAPGSGVVAGQVIDETTKRPVGGAVVTLSAAAGPGQPPIPAAQARRGVAVANGEGRFVFRDVPAGTFSLSATLNNYAPGATGRRRPGGPSSTFTITDGSRVTNAVIPMWKLSTIAGTIRDDRGEPAVGAYVWAYRRVMTADGPVWSFSGGSGEAADDRGQFRVNGLAPGTYTVGISSSTQSNSTAGVNAFRAATSNPDLIETTPFRGMTREGAESGIIRIAGTGLEIDGWQVTTSSGMLQPLPGPDGTILIHPTVFYGNTQSPKNAAVIALAAGEDRIGVDLTLPLVTGVRVSGVLHGPAGPAAGHGLRLVRANSGEGDGPELPLPAAYSTADAQGRFVFLGVPAGSYSLRAYRVEAAGELMARMSGGRSSAPAGPPAPSLFAELSVTVGASHIDNLSLTLTPGAVLAGRVQFTGASPAPTPEEIARMMVVVRSSSETQERSTRIDSTGAFRTPGHAQGRHFIDVRPPSSTWTLASVRVGGVDAAGQSFTLGHEDVTDVLVTFTDRTITLTGSVRADDTTSPPEATVVVMPADIRAWIASGMSPRRTASTFTATGSYQLTIPLPGDYLVVAVPPEVNPEVDPDFAARFAAGAVRVSVSPGETKSVPLTVRKPR